MDYKKHHHHPEDGLPDARGPAASASRACWSSWNKIDVYRLSF